MKKQIINQETREILMTITLPHNDPEKWANVLSAYEFECEIEVEEVEE